MGEVYNAYCLPPSELCSVFQRLAIAHPAVRLISKVVLIFLIQRASWRYGLLTQGGDVGFDPIVS